MGIVPQGIKLIIIGCAALIAGILLFFWTKWIGLPLIILSLIFTLFSLFFFRDPVRDKIFAPGEIGAPGDGKIISISKEDYYDIVVIRIFLSIFNVHLQRAPIDGEVTDVDFHEGKFEIAYKPEAKDNQRNKIRIEGENGRFAEVEQIAGAIARRIACYVNKGDRIKVGDKIGMIYFGSQVALYLPADRVNILVRKGEKVRAGETVIGLWKRKG